MTSSFIVIYDACVIYPNVLRDLLMELALIDFYQAKWTNEIHEEWIRNLKRSKPDLEIEKLYRIRDLMNEHVPECLVTDYQWLIEKLTLPDSNDRHVLAAAIKAKAQVIVTFNLRDFPQLELSKYRIEVQHPDTFVTKLINACPLEVTEAVKRCHQRRKNPPCTFDEYLIKLQKQKLSNTVSLLKKIN